MSESRVIDGEEFEGEEEEEVVEPVKEAPQASADVVDGEEEEEEEPAAKPSDAPASKGKTSEASGAEKASGNAGDKDAKKESEKSASEQASSAASGDKKDVQGSAAGKHGQTEKPEAKQYQSSLEQERTQKFRENRDRLYLNVGKQWSSVYAQVSKELTNASGSGLASSLSVTQDAAKTLHNAASDIQKLITVF